MAQIPAHPQSLRSCAYRLRSIFRMRGFRAHDAYAALSTRGRNQLVPDSTHTIQIAKPEVVISAVIEVLDEIRPSEPHEP